MGDNAKDDGRSGWFRRRFLRATGATSVGALATSTASASKQNGSRSNQFRGIVAETYRYFERFTNTETGLTPDKVAENGDGFDVTRRTSPTNIGMYLLSTVAADELGFLTDNDAESRIATTLDTLENVETWNGLFYRWYRTDDTSIDVDFGGDFISTVDNGWLSAGLVVAEQAYDGLSQQASSLLHSMDYSKLYDPTVYDIFHPDDPYAGPGQMYGGYDVGEGEYTAHHYGAFNTEPRVASYVGIGKGDVPKEHWWGMFRTFPPTSDYDWTNQRPEGEFRTYDGVEVFEGHYEYLGVEYVPSWGGSMFESLMPSLVLKERELGTDALGVNSRRHTQVQRAYANEQGYRAWGFSPCDTPDGYGAFGVEQAGIWGYSENGFVTPHASFLAVEDAPQAVFENSLELRDLGAYGDFGFYDSVNVTDGTVTKTYLALDQGMTVAALTNHLTGGVLRDYFHRDEVGSRPEDVLAVEEFTI
ncbi:glucoamylase family protein [Haladaptatus sp. NG-SE-30]